MESVDYLDCRAYGHHGLLWCLEGDEVSRARNEPEIQIREGSLDPFGPGRRLDGIKLSPPHDRGCVYWGFLVDLCLPRLFLVLGPVPAEASTDRARSGEDVDDRLELLRAHAVLVTHPTVVEMSQVQVGRGPAVADELVRPWERVEVMVPGLALGSGCLRLVADGRMGRVEQDQCGHAFWGRPGEDLRDDRTGVVANCYEAPDVQVVEQGEHVGGQVVSGVQVFRVPFGLVRVTEPAEVHGYGVRHFGKGHDDVAPVIPESRPTVQQDDRLTVSAPHVVQAHPVGPRPPNVTPLGIPWIAIEIPHGTTSHLRCVPSG